MQIENITNEKVISLRLNWESITLYSMYSLSILVPFVIGKPQLLVGSVINFLIVYSTLKYGFKRSTPLFILPSLSALGTGLLFNGATIFLAYTIPFIIISNAILSYIVSKKTYVSYIFGIFLKGAFLVIVYRVLMDTIGLPTIFLTSSYLQFLTAFIGVIFALSLYRYSK